MAQHNDLGNTGEALAVDFLTKKGYTILETNWRYSRAEIDIIAKWKEVMIFIEVKTRSDNYFGEPETFVTQKKMDFMTAGAGVYMEDVGHDWEYRFDIIAIIIRQGKTYIKHIEDAFWN